MDWATHWLSCDPGAPPFWALQLLALGVLLKCRPTSLVAIFQRACQGQSDPTPYRFYMTYIANEILSGTILARKMALPFCSVFPQAATMKAETDCGLQF